MNKRDEPLGDAMACICPRCGGAMSGDVILNPLSRHRNTHVCKSCGYDEAVRDMRGDPLPFLEWHEVKTRLAAGEKAFRVICVKSAAVMVVAASEREALEGSFDIPDEYFRDISDWESARCEELSADDRMPS